MEGKPGNPSLNIISKRLEEDGSSFSFFQSMRLIERIIGKETFEDDASFRARPSLSLNFRQSEVAEVRSLEEKKRIEIITAFLGLYGASSPLPAFYTEDLMEGELEDRGSARVLLDVIHQRLYRLFYKSLKKYRLLYGLIEDADPAPENLLFSLAGLKIGSLYEKMPNPHRLLNFIGLFTQHPRSASGLKLLLENFFQDISVNVVECVPRMIKLPPDQRLIFGGKANRLGIDTVAGYYAKDETGKVAVSIGPLTRLQFHNLVNRDDEFRSLVLLVQFYLTVPIECDLEFIIAENEAETSRLGSPEFSCIGKNAWLFSGQLNEEVRSNLHINLSNVRI